MREKPDFSKTHFNIGDLLIRGDEQFPLFFLVIDIVRKNIGYEVVLWELGTERIERYTRYFGATMQYSVASSPE